MYRSLANAPDEIPEWEITTSGARLTKPSSYFINAQTFLRNNESKARMGYLVKNQYGKKFVMTAIVFERMKNMFDQGTLEVIDYVSNYYVDSMQGLDGFDTEGADAFNHMGV